MRRIPAVAAALVLVAAGLSGCALFEDLGGGDLDDALELVPGEASRIVFVQREAVAERLGIDDIEQGASKEDADRYLASVMADGGATGTTRFGVYVDRMVTKASFSELDIVWEVTATAGPDGMDPLPRIYKLNEDLDLDEVGDDLVLVGYEEGEIAGHRHFFVDQEAPNKRGMVGPYPAIEMLEVVIVPDEHLMFVGDSATVVEAGVEAFEDDAESATDAGEFDDVSGGADDPEYALLVDDPECTGPDGLGAPTATAYFIAGDDATTSSVLAFDSDDQAEEDLAARESYADEAQLPESTTERDGNVVTIDYQYDERAAALAAASGAEGFHACNPG